MKILRAWVAYCADTWLQRFKRQHGLPAAAAPQDPSHAEATRILLHVGCGPQNMQTMAAEGFRDDDRPWREIRLDADADVLPDIIGTMTDMRAVPDAFADAVFSSHGIEHLFWHDVPKALTEFRRVLVDEGFAVVTCPDLQIVAYLIAEGRMFETVYDSAAGPIAPFDIVFGHRPSVERVPEWMSHRCGFTLATLTEALKAAGFESCFGVRRPDYLDLWVLASKSRRSPADMERLAAKYLPALGS